MIQVNPRGKKTKFSSSFYTHFRERTDNKYVVQFKVRPTPRRYKSTVRWTRTRFPTLSRYGTRPCLLESVCPTIGKMNLTWAFLMKPSVASFWNSFWTLQFIISTLQDSIMHQHSDSLHAAVLHVPQLHKVPPQLYRSSCSFPRRQGDIWRVCDHCRRDRNTSQIRSHSQITMKLSGRGATT